VRGQLGRFAADPAHGPHYDDYHFIRETVELQGADVVWVDTVTTLVRPERSALKRLRYRLALGSRARSALRRPGRR
jgi:hypothetical protein